MKRALLWETRENKQVKCNLCHHRCLIADGASGVCGVRSNRDGVLYSDVYNQCIAANIDPIEKKPLYHFLPGSRAYSIATAGCNFRCLHCQNVDISQAPREGYPIQGQELPPERIVDSAAQRGAATIAYTYTEPTIFFEYALDTARLAHERGLRNVFVTNGYITNEALDKIAPTLNAANIDLKFFSEDSYKKVCGAKLAPILETIQHYYDLGIWIELTTLVIPGYNDSEQELRGIARFIKKLSPTIPWHVSRFHPAYKMKDLPSTPEASVMRAWKIGREEGLHFVYVGNMHAPDGDVTHCPSCDNPVVRRGLFGLQENNLDGGSCRRCGADVAGVWT
ncbi:MAG: AmmeMemoRadiSam system radical SAM enzyme [Verrucomicrobiota bacterium]